MKTSGYAIYLAVALGLLALSRTQKGAAVFKNSAWTSPATGYSRSIQFTYDGTNWVQDFQSTVDVPN
jgi:hypothetical protein